MGNVNDKLTVRRNSVKRLPTTVTKTSPKREDYNTEPITEENTKKLKSLSDNKLLKISNENNNEDNLPNSIDTNFSSTKSNTNEINEENEFDDYNSEEEEEESEEENDELKRKESIITSNIKKVFIDSKQISSNKEKEESTNDSSLDIKNEESNEPNSERTPSVTSFDYELNIFRDSGAVRQSYISKLIAKNIWNPSFKPKLHNSLIIFDWDDTLLPTSFLTPKGSFSEENKISQKDLENIKEIEKNVSSILKESIEKGDVYIITNAGINWVQYSSNLFYPKVSELLKKIKIISARGEYEKTFPGNLRQWKIQAFLNLLKNVNDKLVTNIICVGDSLFEIEAGRILASKFHEAFIKTVKFKESPKLDELLKQLKLVAKQFGTIYSSIKNLTIRIERKKNENNY